MKVYMGVEILVHAFIFSARDTGERSSRNGSCTARERILCFVDRASLFGEQFFLVCFFSLHVSGDYVPIIRSNNCIYATLCNCYSVWMTVWYAPPDSHPHRITSTKCRINKVLSPDDGHIFARNMYRKEINMLRKNCAPSWIICKKRERVSGTH